MWIVMNYQTVYSSVRKIIIRILYIFIIISLIGILSILQHSLLCMRKILHNIILAYIILSNYNCCIVFNYFLYFSLLFPFYVNKSIRKGELVHNFCSYWHISFQSVQHSYNKTESKNGLCAYMRVLSRSSTFQSWQNGMLKWMYSYGKRVKTEENRRSRKNNKTWETWS